MIDNITGFLSSPPWPSLVSALFVLVVFYWLIQSLSRWSGRSLDRVREDPVPLIVGLCAAILAYYFYEEDHLAQTNVHFEVVKSIVQFLLLIILGGAVTTIYQTRLQRREDAERHRAERVAITERDKLVLTVIRDDLVSAYNKVKRVRRLLRARLEHPDGKSGVRFVPKSEYNKQMEQVIDAELEFESILRQIEGNVPLFGNVSRLDNDSGIENDSGVDGCLKDIKKHLSATVKEFRRELRNFDGNPPRMNLDKLPRLALFLGLKNRDNEVEAQPEDGSKDHFRDQFRTAIRYLQKEINKLARRINRTGTILWVDDSPGRNSYEIGRLEEDGYDVTIAKTTDEAEKYLTKRLKPMLIISNMGRIENGKFNPEAGMDLLKKVGEENPVYIYASYSAVCKYGKEVEPLGGKGISDSRLLLLRTIDECAEQVEKTDHTMPDTEEAVP
jgi:hypothetical protein